MIGISSKSAGVLLIPKSEKGDYTVLNLIEGCEEDAVVMLYEYSAVQDWEKIEALNADALLEAANREYWLARTVSYLCLTIGGLEPSLERRSLEYIEEMLSARVSSEMVLSRLLVAPLKSPSTPRRLASSALSYGFSATASILEDLTELQPLLQRFTDIWLSIDTTVFNNFSERKEELWTQLVEKDKVRSLLTVENRQDFLSRWNLLVFEFTQPQSRSGISVLGKELAGRLYPGQKEPGAETEVINAHEFSDQQECVNENYEEHQRVKREVESIIQAVAQGQDSRAEQFLRQLIQRQVSQPSGNDYAVKSLCNIAQRCADMYRIDFEIRCLEKALELKPSDAWTLIQYGDYFKRVGRYRDAASALRQAEQYGAGESVIVARSSIADVFSQEGDYTGAINAYKAIPNWHSIPTVRSAIADNLRKIGQLDDAYKAYQDLVSLEQRGEPGFGGITIRAQVGMAEIEKRRGNIVGAYNIYQDILKQQHVDNRDRLIYRFSFANILKLRGEYDEAYRVVDEIIQDYPFSRQARFLRGSILGLLGREQEGLNDVPEVAASNSWQEWYQRYCRGLILFKLRRYDDAKKNLIEELQQTIAAGEHKTILAMAAALCCLGKDEISEADGILSQIPDFTDCYTQYLLLILKLHSAVLKKDQKTMNYLEKCINSLKGGDADLNEVVVALRRKDFDSALIREANAFLKLAA